MTEFQGGSLSMILGPMGASKSTKLINLCNELQDTGNSVIYVNHSIDNRELSNGKCYTSHNKLLHNGICHFKQIKHNNLENLYKLLIHDYDNITIINHNIEYANNYIKINYIDDILYNINNHYKTIININTNNVNNLTIHIGIIELTRSYDSVIYRDKIKTAWDLTKTLLYKYNFIGIDDGQFFDDLPLVKDLLISERKDICIAGLNADANLQPFGKMNELLCIAHDIQIRKAKCVKCTLVYINNHPLKIPAAHTFKLKLREEEDKIIDVGGNDKYCALCLACHLEMSNLYNKNYEDYINYRNQILNNRKK